MISLSFLLAAVDEVIVKGCFAAVYESAVFGSAANVSVVVGVSRVG